MKRLLILTVLLAVANAQTAERNGRAQPRVEIIIPSNTNLFLRTSPTSFVFRAGNEFSLGSSSRTNVIAGSTNRLNSVGLTNSGLSTPTSSLLIGPVFPAPVTNLSPTGRSTGFEGLGPGPAPLVTNAFGQVVTNSVTGTVPGSEVPGPSVPLTPPNTTPLAPPTAPSIPQPTTPSAPPNPNAPPTTPSSPNPTTPNSTPLAPPNTQSLPPTPPAPPPAAPGGTGPGAP